MMKTSKIFVLALLSLASVFSCKKEETLVIPVLTLSPSRINVAAEDVTATFTVKSNATWTVTCSDSWVTSFTKSGSGNGKVTVNFTANTDTGSERRADIFVAVSGKTSKVILTQGKAGVAENLSCEQETVTVPASSIKAEFQIKSNTSWTVSTNADWIRAYTQSGTDDGTLTVEFDPYAESDQDRTADIVVSTSKLTMTLHVVQTKASPKEDAVNVTTRQFNEASDNPDVLYRLTGFVDRMVSMKHGSLILRDAYGRALVYCLKTGKDGEDGRFGELGINVGDLITIVGNRSSFGEDAELVDGYHESHKIIEEISVSDYVGRPDGSSVWYRMTGKVADITDADKGTLVLEDPQTGSAINVVEVVSDYGAETGSFASLGVRKGSYLTIIASSKSNGKILKSIYLEHAAGKLTPGIFAKWGFNEPFWKESSFDMTYTGKKIDPQGQVDAFDFDNTAGDGGRYIEAAEGEGRMTFVQIDKTALDPSGTIAKRLIYYTAQPGAGGLAVGDYFLFDATANVTVPAGTRIRFAFVLRPAGKGIGYWIVELKDGSEWKPMTSLPIQSVTVNDVTYEYNVVRETNEQTTVEATGVTLEDNEDIQIRVRAAAPKCADGTTFNGLCSGEIRFRGENKFSSPYIEIL